VYITNRFLPPLLRCSIDYDDDDDDDAWEKEWWKSATRVQAPHEMLMLGFGAPNIPVLSCLAFCIILISSDEENYSHCHCFSYTFK